MKHAIIWGAGAAFAAFLFFAERAKAEETLEFINFEDLPSKRGPVFGKLGLAGPGE